MMLLSFRIPRSTESKERLLIMRLITSIGLSLLLIFGAAATAHGDFDVAGVGNSVATEFVDTSGSTALVDSDNGEAAVILSGEGSLVGAALCALGVLCGLAALIVLLRALWRPRLSPLGRAGPRLAPPLTTPVVSARASAVSLTQLGLSRT